MKHLMTSVLMVYMTLHLAHAQNTTDKRTKATENLKAALGKYPVTDWVAIKQAVTDGADVNIRVYGAGTPLLVACQYNKAEIAMMMIKSGAKINVASGEDQTPLHYAVGNDANFELVQMLIANGADIHTTGYEGATPLYEAAEAGNLRAVKLLIEKGADVNAKNAEGKRPLHMAVTWHPDPKLPYATIVKLLVEKGADVNAKDKDGITALHLASEGGYTELATLLIDKGADVNAISEERGTPLDCAKTDEMKKLLTGKGGRESLGEDGY
jgi:ankyrin repeat protein